MFGLKLDQYGSSLTPSLSTCNYRSRIRRHDQRKEGSKRDSLVQTVYPKRDIHQLAKDIHSTISWAVVLAKPSRDEPIPNGWPIRNKGIAIWRHHVLAGIRIFWWQVYPSLWLSDYGSSQIRTFSATLCCEREKLKSWASQRRETLSSRKTFCTALMTCQTSLQKSLEQRRR